MEKVSTMSELLKAIQTKQTMLNLDDYQLAKHLGMSYSYIMSLKDNITKGTQKGIHKSTANAFFSRLGIFCDSSIYTTRERSHPNTEPTPPEQVDKKRKVESFLGNFSPRQAYLLGQVVGKLQNDRMSSLDNEEEEVYNVVIRLLSTYIENDLYELPPGAANIEELEDEQSFH